MKTVSISCIDALDYEPTIRALNHTKSTLEQAGIKVDRVYWFSDLNCCPNSIWIKINKFKAYTDEYNYITLKLMPHICTEDYNFIIHADGFAVNADAWTDEFFEYDYIGAGWGNGIVGNGGFTMRSRKLYDALINISPPFAAQHFDESILHNVDFYVIDGPGNRVIPEDNIICKMFRPHLENIYNIKFCPIELADRFSIEHRMYSEWLGRSLGFHGKHGVANHYGVTL